MNKLMNLKSAGAYLGISARSVRRLIDKDLLSYHQIGGLIKISEADLETYLRESRIEATNHLIYEQLIPKQKLQNI